MTITEITEKLINKFFIHVYKKSSVRHYLKETPSKNIFVNNFPKISFPRFVGSNK